VFWTSQLLTVTATDVALKPLQTSRGSCPQIALSALAVIVVFNVIEDISIGDIACFIAPLFDPLVVQAAEKNSATASS
jgi:hypothetical protein